MKSFVIATMALASASVAAAQVSHPPAPAIVTSPLVMAAPMPGPADPPISGALDLDDLASLNGKQGSKSTILSDQDLTAVNRGNTINANSVSSGIISFDGNTFQGFAGVGNFVVNTGHNNNLQGALTINIISPNP